jgi:phage gpG-like protein
VARAFKFSIEIEGEQQVNRLLRGISDRFRDLEPAMEWIADNVFMPAIKGQFASEGRRSGRPWGPYTSQEKIFYVPYKIAMLGTATPILRWKGGRERLYPSFVNRSHPEHIRRIGKDSVEVGSSVPWARKHHLGIGKGYKGKYDLPRRTIVALIESDKRMMTKAVQTYARTGTFSGAGQGGLFI